MTEFISYASPYDLYIGYRSIGDVPPDEQDELIRACLGTEPDYRELVVQKAIKKSQAEGLWSLVVTAGLALERMGRLKDFEARTDDDVQEIIAFLSGTKLWLRLEEAYPPFNFRELKTDYDWSELERVDIGVLSETAGQSPFRVKSNICKHIASPPLQFDTPVIDRMAYHAFKQLYEEGKLRLFVDRMLATLVGRRGMVKNPLMPLLPFTFYGGLLAFIPLWIFAGFWYAVAGPVLAFASKSLTMKILLEETRGLALADKEAYRWMVSRRIIWLQRAKEPTLPPGNGSRRLGSD